MDFTLCKLCSKISIAIQVFISCNMKDAARISEVTTMKKSLKLERIKFDSFDSDLRRHPKFKSEFTKYIQPSYKSEEIVFVLKTIYQKKCEIES